MKRGLIAVAFVLTAAGPAREFAGAAASPIQYRFSFPGLQHHWVQVEARFPDLDAKPLEARISRSSPGRYSLHEFAKNVYDVHAYDREGRELAVDRPDESGWTVPGHGAEVTIKYKVYGDRVDGTYLAVDETHAHMNVPAVVMWARGLDDRPATLTFEQPPGVRWRIATQLHADGSFDPAGTPVPDRYVLTAPNLQYLVDSPVEFGPLTFERFTVGSRSFRFAVHHTGTAAEVAGLVRDVEKIVRQEGAVYGEFPAYEPGYYTFIADYLPYAASDGMEHRNSTVMTSPSSIAGGSFDLLDTVAHEFFHSWNVERIRPRGLEPFDLDRANTSSALWLAEGFTQYYGPLMLKRAGLADVDSTARTFGALVDIVSETPGRIVRSAEEMSRMAPFTDLGRPLDRTNWSISVVSYYPFGGAIALALDLSLRQRSNSHVSLDDYMRALWLHFGKPGGAREGYVDHPYTAADLEATLAEVSGDAAFARDFFARYVHGHEAADYRRLLAAAGFVVRARAPGRPWLGDLRLGTGGDGVAVAGLVAPEWPLYSAGVDEDDEIRQLDGVRMRSPQDVDAIVERHKPGDRLTVVYTDRTGASKQSSFVVGENPHLEVVPFESTGARLTAAERSFRDSWLGAK